jgi:hypothetical protein
VLVVVEFPSLVRLREGAGETHGVRVDAALNVDLLHDAEHFGA